MKPSNSRQAPSTTAPACRVTRAVVDLTKAEIDQMADSRMSAEHDHLNALLAADTEWPPGAIE